MRLLAGILLMPHATPPPMPIFAIRHDAALLIRARALRAAMYFITPKMMLICDAIDAVMLFAYDA